jgi:hypothetical protein
MQSSGKSRKLKFFFKGQRADKLALSGGRPPDEKQIALGQLFFSPILLWTTTKVRPLGTLPKAVTDTIQDLQVSGRKLVMQMRRTGKQIQGAAKK